MVEQNIPIEKEIKKAELEKLLCIPEIMDVNLSFWRPGNIIITYDKKYKKD